MSNNYHVYIEIDEKISEPLIIQLNLIPSANKCLQYLFNNENIKSLLKLDQTEQVQARITSLSIEHGVLSPYTGLFGQIEYISKEEENEIKSLIRLRRKN